MKESQQLARLTRIFMLCFLSISIASMGMARTYLWSYFSYAMPEVVGGCCNGFYVFDFDDLDPDNYGYPFGYEIFNYNIHDTSAIDSIWYATPRLGEKTSDAPSQAIDIIPGMYENTFPLYENHIYTQTKTGTKWRYDCPCYCLFAKDCVDFDAYAYFKSFMPYVEKGNSITRANDITIKSLRMGVHGIWYKFSLNQQSHVRITLVNPRCDTCTFCSSMYMGLFYGSDIIANGLNKNLFEVSQEDFSKYSTDNVTRIIANGCILPFYWQYGNYDTPMGPFSGGYGYPFNTAIATAIHYDPSEHSNPSDPNISFTLKNVAIDEVLNAGTYYIYLLNPQFPPSCLYPYPYRADDLSWDPLPVDEDDAKFVLILNVNGQGGDISDVDMNYFHSCFGLQQIHYHSKDPVDVVSGTEEYKPEPDLVVKNPAGGMPVVFQRYYSTKTAKAGYSSPGLPRGWIHGYDYYLWSTPPATGTWGNLQLSLPDASMVIFTPDLAANGNPTGTFNRNNYQPKGTAFLLTGVPDPNKPGSWLSLTLTTGDQKTLSFTKTGASLIPPITYLNLPTPSPDTSNTFYALTEMTDNLNHSLIFSWDSQRRLQTIANNAGTLLTVDYNANQYISRIRDNSREVDYTYDLPYTLGDSVTPGQLIAVSQVVSLNASAPKKWGYSYMLSYPYQFISTISQPNPNGSGSDSTWTMQYDLQGRISSQNDPMGNIYNFNYSNDHTLVTVYDPTGTKLIDSHSYFFDSQSRGTGSCDNEGHRTLIKYEDTANPYKPTTIIKPDGTSTTFQYDLYGNLLSSSR